MVHGSIRPEFRLRLFGCFELSSVADPQRLYGLPLRKSRALLAFLAARPSRRVTRSEAAALLWGDCEEQQARASLRQALSSLRQELGGVRLFDADKDAVALRPGVFDADVEVFVRLSGSSDIDDKLRAAELYEGPFLADLDIKSEAFEEWLSAERRSYHAQAVELFDGLVRATARAGSIASASGLCERLLLLDPLREETHRFIIALDAKQHGRCSALARFADLSDRLETKLGVAPEPETLDLVTAIRSGALEEAWTSRFGPSDVGNRARPIGPPAEIDPATIPSATPDQSRVPSATGIGRKPPHALGFGRGAGAFLLAVATVIPAAVFGIWALQTRKDAGPALAAPSPNPAPAPSPRGLPPDKAALLRLDSNDTVAIAVLPFSFAGEREFSAQEVDAFTADLSAALTRMPRFVVTSHRSTNRYQGRQSDIRSVARELGVEYLVVGSMELSDRESIIRAQLVHPASDQLVWSGRFRRPAGQGLEAQDDIVQEIARTLQLQVIVNEGSPAASPPPEKAPVVALVRKARAAQMMSVSGRFSSEPRVLYEQALALDPNSVSAAIGLATVLVHESGGLQTADTGEMLDRADGLVSRVLQVHPQFAYAHHIRGIILKLNGRFAEALEALDRAIELAPNQPEAYAQRGHVKMLLGRAEETEADVNKAIRISPRDPALAIWYFMVAEATIMLGKDDAAIAWLERSIQVNPLFSRSYAWIGALHALKGNFDAARRAAAEFRRLSARLSPSSFRRRMAQCACYPAQQERLLGGLETMLGLAGLQTSADERTRADVSGGR